MSEVFSIAICTVGFTEIIKNLIPSCPGWLKTIIAICMGAIFTCIETFVPNADKIMVGMQGVAVATLCYDIIIKRVKEIANDGGLQ